MQRGLGEPYAYYTSLESALWAILRDLEDMPEIRRFSFRSVRHRERIVEVLTDAWPRRDGSKLRAVLGHATDFFAWRSLQRQGLSNDQAAELMIDLAQHAR